MSHSFEPNSKLESAALSDISQDTSIPICKRCEGGYTGARHSSTNNHLDTHACPVNSTIEDNTDEGGGEGRGDGGRVDGCSDGGDAAELEQRRPRRREAAGTKVSTRPTRSFPKLWWRATHCSPKRLAAISDPLRFASFRSPKGRGKVRKKSRPKSLHTGLVHFSQPEPRGSLLFSSTSFRAPRAVSRKRGLERGGYHKHCACTLYSRPAPHELLKPKHVFVCVAAHLTVSCL